MNIIYNQDKKKLCDLLIAQIVELSRHSTINIAVSGGSTPAILFSMMAQIPYAEKINWQNINIYWVDERCVPPTDNESNYKMTYEKMLSKVAIPQKNIFRIMGEFDPLSECDRYNNIVIQNIPCQNGFPLFDMAIMGIGDDGHTSSIFYTQMELLESDKPYEVATNPYSGQTRIAMTGKAILKAKELVFLVTGENKRLVISNIISGNDEAEKYPSYHIIKHRKDCKLYTDVNV